MTSPDLSSIREKMIATLSEKSQQTAVLEFLQWQIQASGQTQIAIQQTILLVLQNHHDWSNISKCIKSWKGIDKFLRSLFKRMKQRVREPVDLNVSIPDILSQLPNLFEKHYSIFGKKQSIVKGIQKYLNPKENQNKQQNTLQSKEESIKNDPKNETTKVAQIEEKSDTEKSNSISSKNSSFSNRIIDKKPTFGMLRRQDSKNSNSNLVSKRDTSRRTFGHGDGLKSIQITKTHGNLSTEQKQNIKNVKLQGPKVEEQKPNQEKKIDQIPQKVTIEIKKKTQLVEKNIFERKQDVPNRPNALFKTEKKQFQLDRSKQKNFELSLSKSVTPQKQLIHRKKIVLKKPSDFEKNFFDPEDEFSSYKKFQTIEKDSDDSMFFSEEKASFPLVNKQEEQLRNEIENERQKYVINKNKSQEVEKVSSKPKEIKTFPQSKPKPLELKTVKTPSFKQSTIQLSMVRQPGQLFSDYEVSLLGFDPKTVESQIDYFKLDEKCKKWSFKTQTEKWKQKNQALREKRLKK